MDTTNNNDIDELLKRTIFNKFVEKYTQVDGYSLGPKHEQFKHLIDNFQVRDNDVWVTSYPKSGTTWTQEMVWLIVNNLNFEEAKRPLDDRFPFLEIQTLYDWDKVDECQEVKTPKFVSLSIEHTINDKSEQRCIKSHLPWELLPHDITNQKKHPKIIHVIRNPKDVCVSFYHHYNLLQYYKGNFEEFKTLFLHNKVLYSPYWKIIDSYWRRRNEPNILILQYEEMKKDLKSVVKQVAKFLNKTVPNEQMDKILEHLSFQSMQKNPSTNYKPKVGKTDDPQQQFIRKGIVGDYKNLMTPEVIAEFDKWIAENNTIGLPY